MAVLQLVTQVCLNCSKTEMPCHIQFSCKTVRTLLFCSGEMVSYNPNLYELADDDLFDYQNNGAFLDDELESMLTTDREKLKKGDLKNDITSIS